MLVGIISGLTAAFMQQSSYVCSKIFINKYQNAILLAVYAYIVMGIMALCTFCFSFPSVRIPMTTEFWFSLFLGVCGAGQGQFFFFRTVKEIEPSRLSSLLGIKIIMLAIFCVYFQHQPICRLQWLGVLLCSFAAIGINFTGGSISWKGVLYLTITLVFYCMSDLYITALTKIIQSDSPLRSAVCATSISYVVMGFFSSLLLIRVKRSFRIMYDSVPYAFFWYGAMILLFISFSEVGVIHGTIIQATRGVISVIMGAVLLKMGYEMLEPRVSVNAWIRRLVMSILMLTALTIYSYARQNV